MQPFLEPILPVDWSTLHKVLRDETRKKIILTLHKASPLTYTDLMNRLEVTNTGSLNYHLKKLNDLVTKDDQGAYRLTERGTTAAELLDKFPSQMPGRKALHASDAFLIGVLGLLLTLPITLLPILLAFFLFPLLVVLYLLIVPGYLMRHLAVQRSESHDLYNLMKPPVVLAGIFYLIVALIVIVSLLEGTSPFQPTLVGENTFVQATIVTMIVLPILPAFGVLSIEAVSRAINR